MNSSSDPIIAAALTKAQGLLSITFPGIRITEIDDDAMHQWREKWCKNAGPAYYDWTRVPKHMREEPYTIAIYMNETLCGLAAYIFQSQSEINVHYIEGSPDKQHFRKSRASTLLKIAEIVGRDKGANKIVLENVMYPKVARVYSKLGYELSGSNSYAKSLKLSPKYTASRNALFGMGAKRIRTPDPQ